MTTDPIPTICFKIRADEYPQPAHRCIHLNQHHLTKFKIAQLKLPLSDHQHNNRTSAAGMPTAWQPQVSVLAVSKEAFGQPGQPAVRSSLCAENQFLFEWLTRRRSLVLNLDFNQHLAAFCSFISSVRVNGSFVCQQSFLTCQIDLFFFSSASK